MVSFQYKITDEIGLHARPAGMLAKAAKAVESSVTIACNEKSADATRLMSVMAIGVKCGDVVTVTVEGADEQEAATKLEEFFKENL